MRGGGKRNFKFEDRWWLDPVCDKIINEIWEGTEGHEGLIMVVQQNLEQCQLRLQSWSRWKFGNLKDLVKMRQNSLPIYSKVVRTRTKKKLKSCKKKLNNY